VNDEVLLQALRAVRAGEPVALDTLGHLLAADFVRRGYFNETAGSRFDADPEYMLTPAGIEMLSQLEAERGVDQP
jgi:hypothetical protein